MPLLTRNSANLSKRPTEETLELPIAIQLQFRVFKLTIDSPISCTLKSSVQLLRLRQSR
jgi:hypothetical protein